MQTPAEQCIATYNEFPTWKSRHPGRKLDNGENKGSADPPFEKKEERRKKNRHGIVVEEMALRPLNSRLLSSQPRNSAYFQLNLLIIAPPL